MDKVEVLEQLTKAKKIKLLKGAKSLINKYSYIFMCNAISHLGEFSSEEVFGYIPELLKYKPKKLYYSGLGLPWWFDSDIAGRKKRIRILEKTIKDIEEQK